MNSSDKFVTIDGKRVHYLESMVNGAKDILVLFHGKSFNARTWTSINADTEINKMGIGFIAVDYPGWGESEANKKFWPSSKKYENSSLFIESFTSQLKLSKFSLLGASFSGPFVISFASNHPEKINKLVLVGAVWSDTLLTEVNKISKPSLIMYGENDDVIPLDSSKKYHESLKSSQLFIVEGARHALYLDKPEEFFRILKSFLID